MYFPLTPLHPEGRMKGMGWNAPEIILPGDIKKALSFLPKQEPKPVTRLLPNSPWAICPVPDDSTRTDRYLFQLDVEKNRRWRITMVDTNTADRRNHASGSNGLPKMDGEVYTGRELFELRSPE